MRQYLHLTAAMGIYCIGVQGGAVDALGVRQGPRLDRQVGGASHGRKRWHPAALLQYNQAACIAGCIDS